ncbi:MAG: AarF/UbiB family protein, partial [Candidatus Caldatribacteriota bacterium]
LNINEREMITRSLNAFIEDESRFNALKAKTKIRLVKKMVDFLNESKGVTIKFAQLLTYLEMGLPIEVRNALGNIQGKLKPLNKKIVTSLLEEAYGAKWGEVFPYFEMKPIAVTSLAQVHLAKLATGEEVAVKIQDPNVKKQLESQFKKIELITMVGGVFEQDLKQLTTEIKKLIQQECNYLLEVENQLKIRDILNELPRVYVPLVYKNLCRENIIVSEFIRGENFLTFVQKAGQDSKNLVAKAILTSLTHLAFVHKIVYADAHFENFLVKNDKIIILDFGRIFHPNKERMKLETMFYLAFVKGRKDVARTLFSKVGFAKDINHFDFDEFWIFLNNTSKHLLINENFKFDKDYLDSISREGRRFSQKKNLKLSSENFWGFAFSSGTWALYAQLEAEFNWHEVAIETLERALKEG